MSIEGPYATERARLDGTFTDADRAWRRQWLKDQHLSHSEPRPVVQSMNPIRRALRLPLDLLFAKLEPSLGKLTPYARYWTGRYIWMGFGVLGAHYYFKYNAHDWTKSWGARVYSSRRAVYPGDPRFPMVSDRTQPSDYADYGFKNSGL